MSANEIELTFIRCQNCKSLMPSTAQACGMCGFKKGEQQEGKSKVRLRQESDVSINDTISEEQNKESQGSENATKEMESPFQEDSKNEKPNVLRRDYLNFGNKEKSEDKKSYEPEEDEDSSDDDFNDNDDDSSEESDYPHSQDQQKDQSGIEDRPKKKKRRRKKKPQAQAASDNSTISDGGTPNVQRDRGFESPTTFDAKNEREHEVPKKEDNFRNDPPVSKQDFKPRDEVMQHSDRPQDYRHQGQAKQEVYGKDGRHDSRQDRGQDERHDNRQVEHKREERREDHRRNDDYQREGAKPQSSSQPEQRRHDSVNTENLSHKNAPRVEAEDGKLMGWLVNYSTNGKGASFELRVGRRFIGRQALRSDDIVIQDSALSTPHSLIQVEGGQVFLQDLMSENGTFVKNSGGHEFVRKDTSTRLVHGDVIRLGSYELIVCLVPSV